ncbi:MAG TPA: cytochrome c, partial [Terriglobia bacterium]|nr:cytochrome c [Terriglobia bacterium]
HGQGAVGTSMAVKLVGVGQQLPPDQLANLIRHPNAKMKAGGMPSFPLSDNDMKSLITYLDSLK